MRSVLSSRGRCCAGDARFADYRIRILSLSIETNNPAALRSSAVQSSVVVASMPPHGPCTQAEAHDAPVAAVKVASRAAGLAAIGAAAAVRTAVASSRPPVGLVAVTATICPGNRRKDGICGRGRGVAWSA